MADTPQHTSGPWHVMPSGLHVGDKKVWFDETNARCGETPNILIECPTEEDANLVAAAPELLEAARETLRLFRYNVEDAADAADFASAVELMLEAVVAKAEGRL